MLILTGICIAMQAQEYNPAGERIKTKWGEEINPDKVWAEYPRPQFRRDEWINLNGLWDYALQRKWDREPSQFQGKILVPFCIESSLSGVGRTMNPQDRLWYRCTFQIPEDWRGKKVILHFDAVDWMALVRLNGVHIGVHKGAYDRFSFDITPYLNIEGKQELVVAVDDPSSSGVQARGKQQIAQQGIWYTPVSGIWQTVWLEAVHPEAALGEVRITPYVDREKVSVVPLTQEPAGEGYLVDILVYEGEKLINNLTVPADREAQIELEEMKLWSPGDPFLYGLILKLKNPGGEILDEVESYFGMRKISVDEHNGHMVLHLNNKPLFHYGTLDQGWWPDGLHTPPSDEAMSFDIEMTKEMGFNMIRKHIKVEPDRWYYHCDRLGIMVWQDMPSGMVIEPSEGEDRSRSLQHVPRDGVDLNRRSDHAAQFEWELRRMIDLHYNAPSIVMWVPFNEGWGQYSTCRIANAIRSLDPTRLVNAVSGWALRPCGNIYDIHSYQVEVLVPPASLEMASVLGEYGGIGYPVKGHQWDSGMRNWGYQTYHSAGELLENYRYKFNQVLEMKRTKGLSAAVYTQTTDVEGEVNGLMTYDRKVIKILPEKLKDLHSVLYD